MSVTAPQVADVAAGAYFAGFGIGFLIRPALVERFGLRWDAPSGKTEIRCYYGAVSLALAGYLVYMLTQGAAVRALTAVVLLAVAVFTTRVVGTAVDRAWRDAYLRLAIPVEAAFVVFLCVIRFTHLGR